ncbi:flippase [Patescibacteria group bacterium]|nr:flippase [Patescibacteria group bacterium]
MKINNIAKNTSYFTFALILQKIISFTYFAVIARALGPVDLGRYYFAISFTTIFAILIDFGLANTLTREVARDNKRSQELASLVLAIKIPLIFIVFGIVILLINLLGYEVLTRNLVYLAGLCMILDSLTLTFFSIIRGFHNLIYESVSSVIFQLIVFCTGLYFLHIGLGPVYLMGAMVVASAYMCLYSGWLLVRKFKIKLVPLYNFKLIKSLVVITIPFSLYAIFQKIYTYLDTVLLSVLAGDVYVGLYQIAFKIIFAIQFLPLAFVASLYPAFSSYWASNRLQLALSFERAMSYLIIISLPIAVGIATIADKLVVVFREGFNDAVIPLQIIMLSLIFIFLNYPIGSLLNACDKQMVNTKIMGITFLVSIFLNLLLIPAFNVIGASVTVVVTNLLMFILGIREVPKIINYDKQKILTIFVKSFASAILMVIFILFVKSTVNIFVIIVLAGLIYFSVLYFLGGFKRNDLVSIVHSFKK